MLTIFQCITMEGWTKMMYFYSDTYFPWITHFYFISLIIICSFFILNLTVAILLDNYAESENADGGLISNTLELIEAGKEASLPEGIIDFIIHQDISTIKKKKKKALLLSGTADSMTTVGKSMTSNVYHNIYVMFINKEATIPVHKYYDYKITRWAYLIAVHPLFNSFIMMIIVFNTVILSFERYPAPPDDQIYIFAVLNFIFTLFFTFEVLIKLLAFSFRGFVRDKFNIFDALVVISSVIELFIAGDGRGGSGLSALRAVRLFRIFKIFRVGDLRVLMDSIGLTIFGMGNYTVLLGLFMYLYALLGMQFFAGKFRFGDDGLYNENGDVPRENFDSIWEAFISITIIMIGDDWNTIMYYGMLSEGTPYSIYFVSLFTFGNIIMLNLFLAILLGNFDSARQLMAKRKAFEEFRKLHKKKVPLKIALIIVLGDLGEYIANNILDDTDSDISDKLERDSLKGDSPNKNEVTRQGHEEEKVPGEKEVRFQLTKNNEEDFDNQIDFHKNNKEELKGTFSIPKNQIDDDLENEYVEDELAQSSDSVAAMLKRAREQDTTLLKTARTKLNSSIDIKSPKGSPNKNQYRSFEGPREIPANQQEGEAYDKELEDDSLHDPSDGGKKLSQINDEEEDSKEISSSHKNLRAFHNRINSQNPSES